MWHKSRHNRSSQQFSHLVAVHLPGLPQFVKAGQQNSGYHKERDSKGSDVWDFIEHCDLGDEGNYNGGMQRGAVGFIVTNHGSWEVVGPPSPAASCHLFSSFSSTSSTDCK